MFQFKACIFCATIIIFQAFHPVAAGEVVVANDTDYQVVNHNHTQLIFASELSQEAKQTLITQQAIEALYSHSFGYNMDEPLTIGLLSANNQIANGFSTQSPFNMQMNYIGGAQSVDYLSATSWLEALLYHETHITISLTLKTTAHPGL